MSADPRLSIRNILVATDFSASARRALEWAIELGQRQDARLILVHALDPGYLTRNAEVQRRILDEATAKLKDHGEYVKQAGLALTMRVEAGKPWEAICEAAVEFGANLIVIGSRGLTGLDRILLGSTADRVVRSASVPVVTVHPDDLKPNFHSAIVAVDFSSPSQHAIEAAADLLASKNSKTATLFLLHCSPPPFVIGATDVPVHMMPSWDDVDEQALQRLQQLARSMRRPHLQVECLVARGYPLHAILEQSRQLRPDFIAVGTQGRTGLERFVMGSVAERVLHHANCPVLTFGTAAEPSHATVTTSSRRGDEVVISPE
jgi:nucleotide-binding universal stress UspA family protein